MYRKYKAMLVLMLDCFPSDIYGTVTCLFLVKTDFINTDG
jgi:hypothetical protein